MKIGQVLLGYALILPAPLLAQVDAGLLAHWEYDRKAPPNYREIGVQARDGVKVLDVTYESPTR